MSQETKKFPLTLCLFLIGTLHAAIIAIFQVPENFLLGHRSTAFAVVCKIILYTIAIGVSLSHQILGRRIGLRKTLYWGLLCNLLGLSTLLLSRSLGGQGVVALVFLDMIFFGAALTSVINSLVTYIVLEFPKRVGMGIISLFAFLNLGVLASPFLLDVLKDFLFPFLIALVLISLWFVHVFFFDPPIRPELVQLRKGTIVWKELHYRLALFFVAIVAYGLAETTFNLWGYLNIETLLGSSIATHAIAFFWVFMIVGQALFLLPLYFFSAHRIFFLLILIVIGAAFYFPLQTKESGFLIGLIAAGTGCSAVFPILLSMMEKEILPFSHGSHILYYIEVCVSVMLAGYFLGVGFVDLWVEILGTHPLFPIPKHVHLAAFYIAITGLIALFLQLTAPKQKKL